MFSKNGIIIRREKPFIRNNNKNHILVIFALSFLCVTIYSNTLNSPFAFDDSTNIEKNHYIQLTRINFQTLYDAGFKSPSKNRPLANISFAINYYFGQYDVTGYHVVNIFIHLINGILVYFLSIVVFEHISNVPNQHFPQFSNSTIPLMSLFAALIFIAHPIQTQSVTYIVQRMNSMASMFCLLSLFLYITGRLSRTKQRRRILLCGCFVSWIMALGSKEIAGILPFVIMIYEWYFFQDLRIEWLRRNLKYFFVLLVLLTLVIFIYLGKNPFDKIFDSYSDRDFTMSERVLTQFRVVVFYVSLLLYPHPSRLNLLHHVTTSRSLLIPPTTLLSMLVIGGIIGLAIYIARRQRLISFCILWFFLNLFIESSVFGLEMIFEHRLYLPMFGFVILAISLLFQFLFKKRFWVVFISISIVLFLCTFTYMRNTVWQNSIALWSDVVSKNPQSYRANHNLGVVLKERGRHKEAIHYFSESLRIKPDFAEIHNNLGFALMEQGRLQEAIVYFSEALQIKPDYAEAYNNMGTALASRGRLKEAVVYFTKAVKIKPDYAEAHNNMGTAMKEQGKLKEASEFFSEALRINPEFAGALNNMGTVLANQGKFQEAMSYFSKAIKIKPDFAEAYNSMGTTLARQGKIHQAIDYFSKALQIKPDYAKAHYNMGTSLANQGRLNEAIDYFSKAMQIKPDFAEAHNSLGIVLARQGRCKEAVEYFSTALQIKPDYVKAQYNLNLCLRRINTSK